MATQKRTTTTLLPGSATHTRTAHDYMAVLLDSVSADDWREVCKNTVQLAKDGDPQARAWLSNFLIGKPESKAPTPINVVVGQWQGANPVIDKLATSFVNRHEFPSIYPPTGAFEANITQQIEAEIAEKLQQASATE